MSFTDPVPKCCGYMFLEAQGFTLGRGHRYFLPYSEEVNRLLLQTAVEYPKFGAFLLNCRKVQWFITYTL